MKSVLVIHDENGDLNEVKEFNDFPVFTRSAGMIGSLEELRDLEILWDVSIEVVRVDVPVVEGAAKYATKVKDLLKGFKTMVQCTFTADKDDLKDAIVTYALNQSNNKVAQITLEIDSGETSFDRASLPDDLQIKLTNLGKDLTS